MTMRVGSLFAGIGGFDLAARWMGWDTAWFSEIEPYASSVLAKHWPGVPNHGDITKLNGADIEPIDILCGGFPCQDISLAGAGAGIGGSRSGLWKHYARLIDEKHPRYVVAENVSAIRTRGLDVVLQDLNALGYDAEWHCIPASHVGAPHRRDRAWIIAYSVRAGLEGQRQESGRAGAQQQDVSNSRWWAVEPDVGRVAHGVPARVDRLRCLGNAIVPQVAYQIFQMIETIDGFNKPDQTKR